MGVGHWLGRSGVPNDRCVAAPPPPPPPSQTFTFVPVETPAGSLRLSVDYQPASTVQVLEVGDPPEEEEEEDRRDRPSPPTAPHRRRPRPRMGAAPARACMRLRARTDAPPCPAAQLTTQPPGVPRLIHDYMGSAPQAAPFSASLGGGGGGAGGGGLVQARSAPGRRLPAIAASAGGGAGGGGASLSASVHGCATAAQAAAHTPSSSPSTPGARLQPPLPSLPLLSSSETAPGRRLTGRQTCPAAASTRGHAHVFSAAPLGQGQPLLGCLL